MHRQFASYHLVQLRQQGAHGLGLGLLKFLAGCKGPTPGHGQGLRQYLRSRQYRHGGAPIAQIRAAIVLGGEQDLPAQIGAEALRKDQGGAETRGEAIAHETAGVEALFGQQHPVTEHPQGPAGAECMALHRRDDRYPATQRQFVDRRIRILGLTLLDGQQAVPGTARGEIPVMPGQHHDLVGWTSIQLVEGLGQPAHQGLGKRIVPGLVLQAQQYHAIGAHLHAHCR